MSWNLRMARPGICDWTSFWMTSDACSHGNTECGGGLISLEATSLTNSCNCSIVPVGTGSICCFLSSALRENFGNNLSATSSEIKTTPPSLRHCKDRCKLRDVVPKSMTMSTNP